MANPEEDPLIIECGDGKRRALIFQPDSHLIAHSVVLSEGEGAGEALEKMGLTDRQRRGLGVGRGIQGWELLPVPKPEDFIP